MPSFFPDSHQQNYSPQKFIRVSFSTSFFHKNLELGPPCHKKIYKLQDAEPFWISSNDYFRKKKKKGHQSYV